MGLPRFPFANGLREILTIFLLLLPDIVGDFVCGAGSLCLALRILAVLLRATSTATEKSESGRSRCEVCGRASVRIKADGWGASAPGAGGAASVGRPRPDAGSG